MKNFIEKRSRVENVLKEYERNKFKIIFEHSPIPIVEQDASSLAALLRATKKLSIRALEKKIKKDPQPLVKAFQGIKFLEVNQAALRLYRVKSVKELRQNILKIFPRVPMLAYMQEFLSFRRSRNYFEFEFSMKRLNNKFIHILMRVAIPEGMEQSLARIIVTFEDITQRRLMELELEKQAHRDSLTKLLNHSAIIESMEHELTRSKRYHFPMSCLLIDLDKFKDINDQCGHLKGDVVLLKMSELLRRKLRKSDWIGRFGGDEFLVVLPETPLERAVILAKRLQNFLKFHQPLKSLPFKLTLSIGVSEILDKTDTARKVIDRADKDLYKLKSSRRFQSSID